MTPTLPDDVRARIARAQAVLFDKDGTLFDFGESWSVWAVTALDDLAEGDSDLARRLGAAIGFDVDAAIFAQDSVVIAGTPAEISAFLQPHLSHLTHAEITARLNAAAETAPLMPCVPLRPFLHDLRARGLQVGVVTNDAHSAAAAHMAAADITDLVDVVLGSDSGHGAKPGPGPLHAAANRLGVSADLCVMVGDGLHDLNAAEAAGMLRVAVLTGLANHADLAPHADIVLPNIGALTALLPSRAG